MPPQSHGSVPTPPPPSHSEISQTNKQPHADYFSAMTQGNRGASIMVGQNEQVSLRIRNAKGRNISSMHTHIRVCRAKAVTGPVPNNTGSNGADTNSNMCFIIQKCIPIALKNRS